MVQISRKGNIPIPFSNDDIMLFYKTAIMTPLMKTRDVHKEPNDLNKKCNEFKQIMTKMTKDNWSNSDDVNNQKMLSKFTKKKTCRYIINNKRLLSPQNQLNHLFKFKHYFTHQEDNTKKQTITKSNTCKQICLSTKALGKKTYTSTNLLLKGRNKRPQFSPYLISDNQPETVKQTNGFLEKSNYYLSSIRKKELQKIYSEQGDNDPIKLTKKSRIFSSIKNKTNSTFVNYIQLKNRKHDLQINQYSQEKCFQDNIDPQLNSLSNSILQSNHKNQSSLFNSTLSTNHGITHLKHKTNSNINPIAKLKESLSAASKELVPKLCKMRKRRFNSEPIKFYKSIDEQEKEKDLEVLLDIKVGKKNKKAISWALNNNVRNQKDVDYRKAVVKFANKIDKVNPETAYFLVDRIKDGYFEKTKTGKYREAILSQELHAKNMKSVRVKMKNNHNKLTALLINIGRANK